MGGSHPALYPAGGRNRRTGRRHPRPGARRRRRGAPPHRPPHRGPHAGGIRNSGRHPPQGRGGGLRRPEKSARRGQSQHRGLPPRPVAARGAHRDDARCPLHAARRADPPRGAVRSGRPGAALLHGADARRPGTGRRMRRGDPLHAGLARRSRRPGDTLRRRPLRRGPHIRRGRRAGRGRHGLRHGEHPAGGQDLRSGQPVCHGCQAAGFFAGCCDRYACRPF